MTLLLQAVAICHKDQPGMGFHQMCRTISLNNWVAMISVYCTWSLVATVENSSAEQYLLRFKAPFPHGPDIEPMIHKAPQWKWWAFPSMNVIFPLGRASVAEIWTSFESAYQNRGVRICGNRQVTPSRSFGHVHQQAVALPSRRVLFGKNRTADVHSLEINWRPIGR